jgi:hypothetical protein
VRGINIVDTLHEMLSVLQLWMVGRPLEPRPTAHPQSQRSPRSFSRTAYTGSRIPAANSSNSSTAMSYGNCSAGGIYQVHHQTEPSDHPPLDFEFKITRVLFELLSWSILIFEVYLFCKRQAIILYMLLRKLCKGGSRGCDAPACL